MSVEDNESLGGANAINLAAAREMTEETGTLARGAGHMRAAVNARTSTPDTVRILELVIAREVQQQLTAYRRAGLDLEIAGRNVKLARDRTELARRLFRAGRGDNFSATDAEEALVIAEDSFLTSKANASISSYRLLQTMGVLLEHPNELKPTQVGMEP